MRLAFRPIVLAAAILMGPGVFGGPAVRAETLPGLPAQAQVKRVLERVYVVEDRRLRSTSFTMVVNAGCVDEPGGVCRGLAHYLEHLILSGRNAEHADSAFRMFAGGYSNGTTSYEATTYIHRVPVRPEGAGADLEKLFTFYAARLQGFEISEADANRERNVVLQEYNLRLGSSAEGKLRARMLETLLPGHPRSQPVVGWPHQIAALSLGDARAFHRDWYVLDNVAFVVSGPTPVVEVEAIARKALASVTPRPSPQRPPRTVRPPVEAVTLRDSDPQVQNPVLILQKLVTVPESDRWSSRGARLLLADFLQSRLDGSPHEVMVEGAKLATGIGLDLSRLAPRQAALTVRVPLDGGQPSEKVVEAVEAYLRDLGRTGIPAETIDRLRTRRLERRVLALAEPQRVAEEDIDWLSGTDRFEDPALWPDRVRAVAAEQVAAYAAALAEPSRRVVGILTPREP